MLISNNYDSILIYFMKLSTQGADSVEIQNKYLHRSIDEKEI